MTKWQQLELDKIGASEEIKLSALRNDGTYYNPVIIWVVRVDDNLYVRSYKGAKGSWFKHIQVNLKGKVTAGGITKEVNFVVLKNEDKQLNDKIDHEYRSKYHKYGKTYVDPMVSPQTRVTTVKMEPL